MTQAHFETEYLNLQGHLQSYLYRLTANRQDAEDLSQETYLKATRALPSFTGASSLKTWVFAIATNLARDHRRVKVRWAEDSQDCCRTKTQADPEKISRMRASVAAGDPSNYEFREHMDFCFTCMAKTLPLDHQLAVILKEIYQFKLNEIVQILNSSPGKVKHALAGGRKTLTNVFESRCSLVNKEGVCHQCSEIAGVVNPRAEEQRAQMALVSEDREEMLALRTALVRGVDPMHAPASALHDFMMELIEETAAEQTADGATVDNPAVTAR